MDPSFPELTLIGIGAPSATVDVILELPSGDIAFLQEGANVVMKSFVEAGRLGGFPIAAVEPTQSRLTLHSSVIQSQHLLYQLQTTYVTPQAFQVLRNQMARLQLIYPPVSRITVRQVGAKSPETVTAPVPAENNERRIYPPMSTKLNFAVEFEAIEGSHARRCVVEHAGVLPPEQVAKAAAPVNAWFELLEGSGFALPIGHPAETDSLGDSVSQFDEVSLEISVFSFRASEQAWNVLMNILGAYSKTGVPVTKVTIE